MGLHAIGADDIERAARRRMARKGAVVGALSLNPGTGHGPLGMVTGRDVRRRYVELDDFIQRLNRAAVASAIWDRQVEFTATWRAFAVEWHRKFNEVLQSTWQQEFPNLSGSLEAANRFEARAYELKAELERRVRAAAGPQAGRGAAAEVANIPGPPQDSGGQGPPGARKKSWFDDLLPVLYLAGGAAVLIAGARAVESVRPRPAGA